jgi:hypothetical protein
LQPGYYKELLLDWYRLYCAMRHGMLYGDLQAQLAQLLAGATAAFAAASSASTGPSKRPTSSILPDVVRSACASVMDVCAVEAQLFGEFFSVNGLSSAALNELLSALCGLLYTSLRPSVIRETDLDALVEVSCVLRGEVRERVAQATQGARRAQQGKAPVLLPPPTGTGAAGSSSSSASSSSSGSSSSSAELDLGLGLHPSHALASFAAAVARLTADVQERLSHRAQLYIRDVLQNHQNTPAELDYPNKLLQKEQEKQQNSESMSSGAALSPAVSSPSSSSRRGAGALLSQWHPVLERTLLLLSKLYRSVDGSVFTYLASEAIGVCTATLLQGGVSIARAHASTDPQMSDGLLFSISHLLLLREQLSPFASVDLEVRGMVELDLSHMREVLPNIFSSVGKWSSFMELVAESAPRVRERRTDSRKHLEAQLKQACEQLIATQTQALLGPLLAFFTRMGSAAQEQTASHGPEHFKRELVAIVAAMTGRPPPGAGAGGSSALGSSLAPPSSPFGTHLSLMLRRAHLYLLNPPTERVLFRPIHRSLVEVFEQLAFFVSTHFKDDAAAASGSSSAAAPAADPLTVYLQESIAQLTHIVQDNFRE